MTIYHKHHIIPRHMGGSDDPSNLVIVSLEKHAALHKQLWEDLKDVRDYVAWKTLSGQMTHEEAIMSIWRLPKSEEHRKKLSIAAKRAYNKSNKPQGRPKGSKNKKPYSEEILKKRSERMSGEKHPMFGKKGLENPNFGKKRPDVAERNKINPPAKGKLKSEETKARMRKPKTKRIVE